MKVYRSGQERPLGPLEVRHAFMDNLRDTFDHARSDADAASMRATMMERAFCMLLQALNEGGALSDDATLHILNEFGRWEKAP